MKISLAHFSLEPSERTCPFKTKISEDPEAKLLLLFFFFNIYIPWAEAALQATAKDFHKITEAPHRFAEEFNMVIQTVSTYVS